MLWIDPSLRPGIPEGREFEFLFDLRGEVYRAQKNRRMIRVEIAGRWCFVKTHGPSGWAEIAKNAARGRWPTLTAEPECRAIHRLGELGIPTVKALGWGVRGRAPSRLESFIITEELSGYIHLCDLPPRLLAIPATQRWRLKQRLIRDVARIARQLHDNGLNHRDFYLNHFMLPERDWRAWRQHEDLQLHVIDLHRMQIRHRTPPRWVIKDVSGLLFSALDADLNTRDFWRFLSEYWQRPWQDTWTASRQWRLRVLRRAVNLYQSEHGRPPRLPAALASSA